MKRLISAALVAAMALPIGTAVPVSAASSAWQSETEMTTLLSALDIMVGDDSGDFRYDDYVSRAEMAKIAVASSSYKNTVALGLKFSPFSDVPSTSWAAPYIQAAVSAGIVEGHIDGTFDPDGTVTYEEACTMMLRVLGYTDDDFGSSYPYGQVGMAQNLKMTEGMDSSLGEPLTRRQVGLLVCNSLDTAMKDQDKDLITIHDCEIVEDVTIIADQSEDSTLASDEIKTSNGKYRIRDNFDDSYIGSKGDLVVKDGKYFVAFSPDGETTSDKYVIYSTLNDAILCYREGDNNNIISLDISSTVTCYKDSVSYTYGSLQSEMEMGDTIRVRYKDNGEIDYINYSESSVEGPMKVTSSNWMDSFDTDSSTKIMRDGVKVDSSSIQTNDIIYYSSTLNMILAYSKKVTGIYESASPSKDMPQSITVSGVEYEVEGAEAFNDLSSSGEAQYGDTVTLLLGRDGSKVAGIITSESVQSDVIVGYITGSGKKTFTNSDGTTYSSYYVDVVTPDGSTYSYPTDYNKESSVNTVSRLTIKDGKATVGNISTSSTLSGYVSSMNMTIGNQKVASNVQIIDVAKNATSDTPLFSKIYMQRIAGLELSTSQVKYYSTNTNGEIDELILQNVTGDMYTYGIVTSHTTDTKNFTAETDSESYSITNANLTVGTVVQFIANGSTGESPSTLRSYSGTFDELTQSTATIGGTEYKLSDKVAVYRFDGQKYFKLSVNDAIEGDYSSYTCYYDKAEDKGGRIRVIIVK